MMILRVTDQTKTKNNYTEKNSFIRLDSNCKIDIDVDEYPTGYNSDRYINAFVSLNSNVIRKWEIIIHRESFPELEDMMTKCQEVKADFVELAEDTRDEILDKLLESEKEGIDYIMIVNTATKTYTIERKR